MRGIEGREPAGARESRSAPWRRARLVRWFAHGQGRQARERRAPARRRHAQAARAAGPVQDRAGARRRRVHRRRVRDRRAAGARPAVGQPLRQPVRRLRRHERGRARRGADRERRDARADDAGRQQPGADAVPRHQPGHAAAAELPRVRRPRASSCRCTCSGSRATLGRERALVQPGRPRVALAEALPSGLYSGSGLEEYVRTVLTDPDRTDDFRLLELRALPRRDRPRHVRAARARRRGLGRRADLDRRARLGGAADGLPAGRGQAAAS